LSRRDIRDYFGLYTLCSNLFQQTMKVKGIPDRRNKMFEMNRLFEIKLINFLSAFGKERKE